MTTTNLGLGQYGASDQFVNSSGIPAGMNSDLALIDAAFGARAGKAATQTVANSTTQTVVHTVTIPAGSAVAGTMYRLVVWGRASVTGTPTLTIRGRIGGLAGQALGAVVVTAASGASNKAWRAEIDVLCVTNGAAATWRGSTTVMDALTAAGHMDLDLTSASVTQDSTVATDLVCTVQWSAASASNTLTVYGAYGHRVS